MARASAHLRRAAIVSLSLLASLGMTAAAQAGKPPGAGGGGAGGSGGGGGKPDKTAPTVVISAPTAGATLTGTTTIAGSATDDVGVARVDVRVDSGAYQPATGTSSWSFAWSTATYADGAHLLTVQATDTSGNASTATVSITVRNAPSIDTTPPSVSIALPTAGSAVNGTVSVSGSSADNTALAKVEVSIDAGAFQPAQGTASWSFMLDTAAYSNGTHSLTARATDAAGNTATASESVTLSNAVPTSSSPPVTAPPMSAGTIGGFAFQESDRDGVFETNEQPLANQHLFLFDGSGNYLANAYTDATGWYEFTALGDGAYSIQFAPQSWWSLRQSLVPDTTGSLQPIRAVQLSGSARADFGWRPIVRSTDPNAPISTYVGANGLTVQSYDDVVPAKDVYDHLTAGSLVGAEARFVTIRFDFSSTGSTSTMAVSSNGVYTSYHATSNVTYLSLLDSDSELFHEYGVAWSLYYAYMVQQDATLSAYLQARGLLGDPRVGSSYPWNVGEMIAEDYRQLFGTGSAQAASQLNTDIPPAAAVPGLRDFLQSVFTRPPSA